MSDTPRKIYRRLCRIEECKSYAVIGPYCKKHHKDPSAPCGRAKTGIKTGVDRKKCAVKNCTRIALVGSAHCSTCMREMAMPRSNPIEKQSAWKNRLRMGKRLTKKQKEKATCNFEPTRVYINPAVFK